MYRMIVTYGRALTLSIAHLSQNNLVEGLALDPDAWHCLDMSNAPTYRTAFATRTTTTRSMRYDPSKNSTPRPRTRSFYTVEINHGDGHWVSRGFEFKTRQEAEAWIAKDQAYWAQPRAA
jgi:hypothetical protein